MPTKPLKYKYVHLIDFYFIDPKRINIGAIHNLKLSPGAIRNFGI